MSQEQLSDTDLINELVADFGKNQQTLRVLVGEFTAEAKTNLDPIAQSKLKLLRRSMLIEDLKSQTLKIDMLTNVLDTI